MSGSSTEKVQKLIRKGVRIPNPAAVDVGEDIDIEQICKNVCLYPGCRIVGCKTVVADGARLGTEGPVTVDNCRIGASVELKSGFFQDAVFLENACLGYNSHVRGGTILEESASIAHSVGLKHTILFPYVTLGSLINFCDCLMSGGTGPKDHSEVGSAYIHFNFTPNQDKATASLIGDVPHGVMMNQPPIFLGGQGGLVGPAQLAFGTVLAAGTICRSDVKEPGFLVFEAGAVKSGQIPFERGTYRGIRRIVRNNLLYVGNLMALLNWYRHVRKLFVGAAMPEAVWLGLVENLQHAIAERLLRLSELCDRLTGGPKAGALKTGPSMNPNEADFLKGWPALKDDLQDTDAFSGDPALREALLEALFQGKQGAGNAYLTVIRSLSPDDACRGSAWLQGIVDQVASAASRRIAFFSSAGR